MNYFNVFINSILWVKALNLANKEKYEKSLICIKKIEKNRKKLHEEFYLLKGFLLFSLSKDKESLELLGKAIEKVKKSVYLNDDERVYLINYASDMAFTMKSSESYFSINDNYNVNNVAKHLRKKFPYKV